MMKGLVCFVCLLCCGHSKAERDGQNTSCSSCGS